MSNITIAVTFVWILNILMWMSQAAIVDLNPTADSPIRFYNCSGTVIQSYSTSPNCDQIAIPNSNSINSELPISVKQTEETSGFFIVDVLSSAKNWITDKLEYFGAIVTAPYSILKAIPGLPNGFAGAIAIMWYAISIFLLVAFILGRQ